jgi:putative tryptophan/tyrosine transport system substrate-binding protein
MKMALVAARRTMWALCFCAAHLALAPAAVAQNIALVVSENTPTYNEIANSVKRLLKQQASPALQLSTLVADDLESDGREILKSDFYSLVVTIGARAAGIMADLPVKAPVLNTLIPRALYERLPRRVSGDRTSAIYLDQPLARQLELARLVLPGKSRLGFLYSAKSAPYLAELERLAKVKRFTIVAARGEQAGDVGPMLGKAIAEVDFLFALPDADIYNRTTLPKILLSSYRSRRPLISFSAAHVKSGALAAVFTTPEHLARHIAELVLKLESAGTFALPPPQYSIYWSVSVNRQVAQSLGLTVSTDKELQSKLSEVTEGIP